MSHQEALEDGVRQFGEPFREMYVYNCAVCGREVRVMRYDRTKEKRCFACREMIRKAECDSSDEHA